MALDTVAVLETAIDDVFGVLQEIKPRGNAFSGLELLLELQADIAKAYIPDHILVLTDATDASPTAAFASTGQAAAVNLNDVFRVSGVADFTDNALATAKGGAVAALDLFQRTGAGTVKYLGAKPTFGAAERGDF